MKIEYNTYNFLKLFYPIEKGNYRLVESGDAKQNPKDHFNKDLGRRILYYVNFFIIFPCILFLTFWAQTSWVPIQLVVIIGYAIAATILHFVIKKPKKPLNTRLLAVWTGFLVISFISMILRYTFWPYEYVIFLIP